MRTHLPSNVGDQCGFLLCSEIADAIFPHSMSIHIHARLNRTGRFFFFIPPPAFLASSLLNHLQCVLLFGLMELVVVLGAALLLAHVITVIGAFPVRVALALQAVDA